jgi:type II secretory pathway component PulK
VRTAMLRDHPQKECSTRKPSAVALRPFICAYHNVLIVNGNNIANRLILACVSDKTQDLDA